MKRKFAVLLSLILVFSGLSIWAQVQAGLGALSGTVTDPSKAIIPGAKVTLLNTSIGYSKTVTTGPNGEYVFGGLTVVGGYEIDVVAPGFAKAAVKDLSTSTGTVTTQNVTLPVGSEGTVVEVQGANVEQVQTDTSQVSQLIDSTVWQDSPLSVRNQNTFVGLVAGAAPDDASTGRGFAVNGARTGTGNFSVDGFDNNDQGQGGAGNGGGAVTQISPDAIQEYRVISSVPNAEYGRAGGFATDTVLRSGTDKWHGSAFDYNRIQALAQNNFFSKRNQLQDHLVRNQFGGSLGGAIKKDKTFFFATAEFQRQRTGSPTTYTGITQDFYNFVKSGAYETWMEGLTQQNTGPNPENPKDGLSGVGFCPFYINTTCAGAFKDAATTGPVFNKVYALHPSTFAFGTTNRTNAPTDLLLGSTNYLPVDIYGTGNIIEQQAFDQNRGSIKLDHKLTERDQLSFTYLADLGSTVQNTGGGDSFPGPPLLNIAGSQLFGARWTHTFTPNLLNDFRAGYTRHVSNFTSSADEAGISSMFAADSLGTGFGQTAGFPQYFTDNEFTYEDAATYTLRAHTIKGGFRFIRTRNGSSFYNDVNGTLIYWGTPGLMTDGLNELDGEAVDPADFGGLGALYEATASQDPTTLTAPDPYRAYRANEFSAYAQDDWKVSPRLTINYGIRWEYFGPPHNARPGIDSNVYFGTASTLTSVGNPFVPNAPLAIAEQGATFQYAETNGRDTIWNRDFNNFGPRFGFAYDALGNGRLVLRGGFGIGYDRLYNNVYENIRFNGPRFVDNSIGAGIGQNPVTAALRTGLVQAPFIGNNLLTGASPVPRHVNQNLKTAYYEQIHVGMETGFGHGYVGEINYIGTLGRQLVGLMNANTYEGRTACASTATAGQKALCTAAGLGTLPTARPNARFGNDNFRTNGFSSNYNGIEGSLRKGYNNGLQFTLNYTYSKALDIISDVFTVKGGATGIHTPYNPSHDYGPADFDIRHNAVFTVNYVSRSSSHPLLLGGWGISPIVNLRSGSPIYMFSSNSGYDPNKDGTTGVDRIAYVGSGKPTSVYNHKNSPAGNGQSFTGAFTKQGWAQYTCPITVNAGLFCDVPGDRNQLTGLRYYNIDAAISKHIPLGERFKLTLQAAFFNVDGHTQFSNPSGDFNSPNFGTSTSAGNREGQLSGRIDF